MAREHLLKIGVSGIRGVVGEFLTPRWPALSDRRSDLCRRRPRGGGPRYPRQRSDAAARGQCGLAGGGLRGRRSGRPAHAHHPDVCRGLARTGGIALTASHNPPEYNALKLFNSAGSSSTTTNAKN